MRFKLYFAGFLFTVVLYSAFALFSTSEFIESIVAGIFILSTILFIFTKEEKVESEGILQNPKVHYYQNSRINYYGYFMVVGASLCALTFYVASTRFELPIGLVSLFFWLVMISLSIIVSNYFNKIYLKTLLVDYILMFSGTSLNFREVELIIEFLLQKDSLDANLLVKKCKSNFKSVLKEDLHKIINLYVFYVKSITTGNELVSDEVAVLNEKSRIK